MRFNPMNPTPNMSEDLIAFPGFAPKISDNMNKMIGSITDAPRSRKKSTIDCKTPSSIRSSFLRWFYRRPDLPYVKKKVKVFTKL
jgi:hypothetical protein